jgi:hypothetical protein
MSSPESMKDKDIHRRSTARQIRPTPRQGEGGHSPETRWIGSVPDDRTAHQQVAIPTPHRPVVEVMVGPVVRKLHIVNHSHLPKTDRWNQDPPTSRRVLQGEGRLSLLIHIPGGRLWMPKGGLTLPFQFPCQRILRCGAGIDGRSQPVG